MLIAQLEKEHKPHKYSLTLEIIRSVMQINKYIRSYPKRKECSLIQKNSCQKEQTLKGNEN